MSLASSRIIFTGILGDLNRYLAHIRNFKSVEIDGVFKYSYRHLNRHDVSKNLYFFVKRRDVKMEEWYETDMLGQLFIDTVFVEADTLILFTCRDNTGDRLYLVMTIDFADGRYLIAPISTQSLLNLTNKNISVDGFFKEQKKLYLSCFDDDFNLNLQQTTGNKLSADDLPEPNTYLEKFNHV